MTRDELVTQWLNGIKIAHVTHLRCAALYQKRHRALGIPVTALTFAVGTSIFATLESTDKQAVLIAAGLVSALAAILSGLQTFLNYGELASRHAEAGKRFGKLRKRFEEFIVTAPATQDFEAELSEIREEWDALEESAPTPPQSMYDGASQYVRKRKPEPVPA